MLLYLQPHMARDCLKKESLASIMAEDVSGSDSDAVHVGDILVLLGESGLQVCKVW